MSDSGVPIFSDGTLGFSPRDFTTRGLIEQLTENEGAERDALLQKLGYTVEEAVEELKRRRSQVQKEIPARRENVDMRTYSLFTEQLGPLIDEIETTVQDAYELGFLDTANALQEAISSLEDAELVQAAYEETKKDPINLEDLR